MFIMSRKEVERARRTWAANVKAPIDRDTQIKMMKTAQDLNLRRINKIVHRLDTKGKDNDPLG
jgi:tagatose-1,6-bisphosphate aldolase